MAKKVRSEFSRARALREVILRFQTKYAIHSLEVIGEDCPALQWVTETDLSKWRFAIDQFTKAGGVLKDLPLMNTKTGSVATKWDRVYQSRNQEGRGSFASPLICRLRLVREPESGPRFAYDLSNIQTLFG
jgi:hypothetical protein